MNSGCKECKKAHTPECRQCKDERKKYSHEVQFRVKRGHFDPASEWRQLCRCCSELDANTCMCLQDDHDGRLEYRVVPL